MLGQRRIHGDALELQRLASCDGRALSLRNAELVGGFDGDRRADDLGLGLPRDWRRVGHVVEMSMADEYRVGLLDVARHDAGRPIARAAIEISIEQEHLAAVD